AAVEEIEKSAWQGKRDVAILTLLYGCGLRISEALGLKRREAPHGEMLAITGKGRKDRIVPVLPVVREAVADYLAACPYPLPADGPLFVGARGGALNARIVQRQMEIRRRRETVPHLSDALARVGSKSPMRPLRGCDAPAAPTRA